MANDARNTRGTRGAQAHAKAITLLSSRDTTGAGTAYWLAHPYTVFGVSQFRATTGAAGGSTKALWRLQGAIDNSSNVVWYTIGSSSRAGTKTPGTLSTITSTAPVLGIRAAINGFTTSSGANPDKVKFTLIVAPQT